MVAGPTVSDAVGDPNNAIAKLVAGESNDARLVNELFLRVVNRPATADEIAALIDSMNAIETDHSQLTKSLQPGLLWVRCKRTLWNRTSPA